MLIKIVSKLYGDGENPTYDPRFPGYFSGVFNIRGVNKTINNLKLYNLHFVVEEEMCECIKDFDEYKEGCYALIRKITFNDKHSEYSLDDSCFNVSNFIEFSYL